MRALRRITGSAAAVLFLISPVFGELLSSSSPLPGFLLAWLPLAVLYGSGALLVRELSLRWRAGWLGIFLLGAAYGIVEEGLVVRSFFDPGWEDLGLLAEYGRAGGVNWVWTVLLTIFHSAVSIGAAIAAVEIAFPERREEPWLGRRGMWLAGAGVAAWVAVGDAGFMDASGGLLAGSVLVVALLAGAARYLPQRLPAPPEGPAARPRRFFWLAFLGSAVIFLFPHAAAEGGAPDYRVTISVMLAALSIAAWLYRRWAATGTDDRHRAALVAGTLGFLVGLVALMGDPVGLATSAVAGFLIWRWMRHVNEQEKVGV